jgi:hypothetical protein
MRPQFTSARRRTTRRNATTLAAQTFSVSLSLVSSTVTNPVGSDNNQTADLMGRWDADIQRGDTFTYNDLEFTVTTVIRRDYAVNAEAVTDG